MTTKTNVLFLAIGALLITSGCVIEGEPNGKHIHRDPTQSVNGEAYGVGHAGTEVFGPSAEGTSRSGVVLLGVALQGSALVSKTVPSGALLTGADLAGATFRTVTPALDPVELRIDAVELDTAATDDAIPFGDGASGIHRYTIAYSLVDEPGWVFVCGIGADGQPVKAIALEHLWDYRRGAPGGGSKIDSPGWITFACDGFALAACVDLGYRPWSSLNGTSLAAHHQACTRMIRADYCGDGKSWSPNHTAIDVFDSIGIQQATPSLLRTEAEWTEAGARCVNVARNPLIPAGACTFELNKEVCGNPPHWDRTLLVSKSP